MRLRKWRNIYRSGTGQLSYVILFGLMSVGSYLGTIIALALVWLFSSGEDVDLQWVLDTVMSSKLNIALLVIFALFNFAFSMLLGLLFTHKTFGPSTPMTRHVMELMKGNYASRIHLRKDDHFLELADKLNGLAEKLGASDKAAKVESTTPVQ